MRYLFLLFLLISLIALPSFSQTNVITSNIEFIYSSPQSISNHVYYLSLILKGEIINGTSAKVNITSISGYIGALGLPPLPLNGVPISPPLAIGDNIYFIYVPNVTAISLAIKKAYLACANYTNGSWHLKNLITRGIVTGISAYNNSVYALWKSSGKTYLLTISQGRVVSNVTLSVANITSIEAGNGAGVVSNASLILSIIGFPTAEAKYYVINLSTGKVLYEIPDYNNISPALVSVSGNLALVAYITNASSILVLYSLTTGKILSEKIFEGIIISSYINDKFILVEEVQKNSNRSAIGSISIYNLSWGLVYQQKEYLSPFSFSQIDGLYLNSTNLVIIMTRISVQHHNNQTVTTSTLKFITALQAPKPFTIYVTPIYHPGVTTLNISWNANPKTTYSVYFNGTLITETTSSYVLYNVTENGTYLVKIVAENPLGKVEENVSIKVIVKPIVTSVITSVANSTSSHITSAYTKFSSVQIVIVVIIIAIIALAIFLLKRR